VICLFDYLSSGFPLLPLVLLTFVWYDLLFWFLLFVLFEHAVIVEGLLLFVVLALQHVALTWCTLVPAVNYYALFWTVGVFCVHCSRNDTEPAKQAELRGADLNSRYLPDNYLVPSVYVVNYWLQDCWPLGGCANILWKTCYCPITCTANFIRPAWTPTCTMQACRTWLFRQNFTPLLVGCVTRLWSIVYFNWYYRLESWRCLNVVIQDIVVVF